MMLGMLSIHYILIAGALLATVASARFWDRQPRLRLLPVYYSLIAGIVVAITSTSSPDALGILKCVAASLVAGTVLYISVWIQCR